MVKQDTQGYYIKGAYYKGVYKSPIESNAMPPNHPLKFKPVDSASVYEKFEKTYDPLKVNPVKAVDPNSMYGQFKDITDKIDAMDVNTRDITPCNCGCNCDNDLPHWIYVVLGALISALVVFVASMMI